MARRPNAVIRGRKRGPPQTLSFGVRKGPAPNPVIRGAKMARPKPCNPEAPPVIPKRSEESGAGASNTPQPSVRRAPTPTHTPSRGWPETVHGANMRAAQTLSYGARKGPAPNPVLPKPSPCHSEAQRGIWGRGSGTPQPAILADQHQRISSA